MGKTPFLFLFFTILIPIIDVHAQSLDVQTNQRSYMPGDSLVIFGKASPNDALIIELFKPSGERYTRLQVDVNSDGSFSKILLEWPSEPTEKLPLGTYTLIITSGINPEISVTKVIRFQLSSVETKIERELLLSLSIPSVVGRGENATLIIQTTLNGVPLKVEPEQSLKSAKIYYPDGNVTSITDFRVIEDGIYTALFRSEITGHHIINVRVEYQDLVASSVAGVDVTDGSILSLGRDLDAIKNDLNKLEGEVARLRDDLDSKTSEMSHAVAEIERSVKEISSAAGQATSLLLPVIGMIAIIVALQATILARRK